MARRGSSDRGTGLWMDGRDRPAFLRRARPEARWPVTYAASSVAKNATDAATSSGRPYQFIGTRRRYSSRAEAECLRASAVLEVP